MKKEVLQLLEQYTTGAVKSFHIMAGHLQGDQMEQVIQYFYFPRAIEMLITVCKEC